MEILNLTRSAAEDSRLVVAPAVDGMLHVWERPLVGCRYLVSVRGGGALKSVGGIMSPERSVVMVLRRGYVEENSGEKIRTRLACRLVPPTLLDPTPLGKVVAMVADWYGGAPCLVETKDGAIVAQQCQESGASVQVRAVLDRANGKFTDHLGWLTDEEAQPAVWNALRNAFREKEIQVECRHFRAQMETFVPPGSTQPAANHDEDVWTLAVGLYNIEAASLIRPHTRARTRPPDGWRRDRLDFAR